MESCSRKAEKASSGRKMSSRCLFPVLSGVDTLLVLVETYPRTYEVISSDLNFD